ncbi:class I SAM-dependent methyltransferase [Aquimarina intermedia]|uniref:Methyltransferase family protein n=1 Tax=Aquimarina intermedia TaxID=350814 RepID=A0A5S5BRV6_9FLAO|nr:class I SAM-dependent methyltransferase [Aquimarina intermedia]TYP69921.1 methyltransferase family protein [Aquimarina intermedia]
MLKDSTKWYASWFDTPYYHILYKDRDHTEAHSFMDKLTQYLNLNPGEKVLDLACGKGRHSIYLNSLGLDVTGVDLSPKSIEHAQKFSNETLNFAVHDMCKAYGHQFDAVFNLFTSFGYFDHEEDNLNTLKAIKADLNSTGIACIDFLNVPYILNNLVAEETKVVDNISFDLKRYYKEGHIFKEIRFSDKGEDYFYTERVKAITLADFKQLFEKADIYLLDTFGDYSLSSYHENHSPRLILIFK